DFRESGYREPNSESDDSIATDKFGWELENLALPEQQLPPHQLSVRRGGGTFCSELSGLLFLKIDHQVHIPRHILIVKGGRPTPIVPHSRHHTLITRLAD